MSAPTLDRGWRDAAWERLAGEPFDLLVVGGGITGAGIARRAAQAGLRTAVVERRDLAWGTSSRSSKLVHGGLRYLRQLQVGVVRDSVAGREALLRAAPGLVDELGFLMPLYRGVSPGRLTLTAGLAAYDLLAGRRTHRHLGDDALGLLAPRLRTAGRVGGFRYGDAWTDDARLVFRVIDDARSAGATVLSYATVIDLLRDPRGRVVGATVRDDGPAVARSLEVRAAVVVNATGAAADGLRRRIGATPRIRPLRGSHLFFPAWRLPVAQAISVGHPADGRPVFAYPWEGVTIVGTTDVDEEAALDEEPRISAAESAYLQAWLAHAFPALDLTAADAVASMAGVRPVIGTGQADPSAESREHVVWDEAGLVTVTGGKLTTFDAIAIDALRRLRPRLSGRPAGEPDGRSRGGPSQADAPLDPVPSGRLAGLPTDAGPDAGWAAALARRLAGRYGARAGAVIAAATAPDDFATIEGTRDPWVALRWAARSEGVVHLDDLLLRRVRLGLQVADGGTGLIDRIRRIAGPELGWDDGRWAAEVAAYRAAWSAAYAPPEEVP